MASNQAKHSPKVTHMFRTDNGIAENRTDTDISHCKDSAKVYGNRAHYKRELSKGDWWVALGVYLLLLSCAAVFVA